MRAILMGNKEDNFHKDAKDLPAVGTLRRVKGNVAVYSSIRQA